MSPSPPTGIFTQEDPLGLAGGLNAYGFAGGDPVTGRSLVNEDILTTETVVHEFIHAAGAYAGKGFDTGVPAACETGHADQCSAMIKTILDEVKAARKKPSGPGQKEPES